MFFISKLLTKTFQQTDPGDEIYNTIILFAAHGRKTVALACKKKIPSLQEFSSVCPTMIRK